MNRPNKQDYNIAYILKSNQTKLEHELKVLKEESINGGRYE